MKLVLPLGKNKMVSAADFDVEPRFGCACSNKDGRWLTSEARIIPDIDTPLPFNCCCQCSYGESNRIANHELGLAGNEW